MRLYLVRHAQPAWANAEGRADLDPPLTEAGRAQARRTAELGARRFGGVSRLWVSPAVRARETAEPMIPALGLEPEIVQDFRELELPAEWAEQPAEVIREAFAAAQRRPAEAWWEGMPGGESPRVFSARVRRALDAALAGIGARPRVPLDGPADAAPLWDLDDPKARAVIVAHGGANAVMLERLLGIPPVAWPWERFVLRHAGVVRLAAAPIGDAWVWSLHGLDEVEHLPPELRTR
jgi:broad specificity phosphatase PhoE